MKSEVLKKCAFCGSNPEKRTLGYACSGDNENNRNVLNCPLNCNRYDGDCDADQWNMRHEDARIKEVLDKVNKLYDSVLNNHASCSEWVLRQVKDIQQILKGDE